MQPSSPTFIDERSESTQTKLSRALVGALYGLLGGTAFIIIASLADFLFHPALPLGLDWDFYTFMWLWLGPGLALVGFATAWWHETWTGLFTGTLIAAMILLASNMPASAGTTLQKVLSFIIIFLPSMAVCLPVTIFLRWLVRKHFEALHFKNLPALRIAGLFLLVLLLTGASGLFMRMPPGAAEAVTIFDMALHTEPEQKSRLYNLPGLAEHRAGDYQMYYAKSEYSSQGYDVRAVYQDGYIVICTVVVYPGRPAYITKCESSQP